MTRKDFKLIAGVLRIATLRCDNRVYANCEDRPDKDAVDEIISNMAAELARTNPRFDREEFLEACR
jgi:hypothetical protein